MLLGGRRLTAAAVAMAAIVLQDDKMLQKFYPKMMLQKNCSTANFAAI
jgi:hypothetical protein